MNYLNLGCGNHFSLEKEWTNVDFVSTGETVQAYNLTKGVPFQDDSFDLVYHSHVLEHFDKSGGFSFIQECHRVLKPNGLIRIAIPDLEGIARNYLKNLELADKNPEDTKIGANYDWIMLEMYDQTVRNVSGGMMVDFLAQSQIPNKEYVIGRIGWEGEKILEKLSNNHHRRSGFKSKVKSFLMRSKLIQYYRIGRFRKQGEIHQWMYDRYSLRKLLESVGFHEVKVVDAFSSSVPDWKDYQLDGERGKVRKPDSVFMEALKE